MRILDETFGRENNPLKIAEALKEPDEYFVATMEDGYQAGYHSIHKK